MSDVAQAKPETQLTAIPGGKPDLDAVAKEVAEAAAVGGQPIRLRLQPDLFLIGGGQQYRSWTGVNWKAEFATLEELVVFREDLGRFMATWFEARR